MGLDSDEVKYYSDNNTLPLDRCDIKTMLRLQ